MPEGMRGQCVAALPTPVNWRLPCVYPYNTKFSGHVTSGTRPYKFSRAWGRGYIRASLIHGTERAGTDRFRVLFHGTDLQSSKVTNLIWNQALQGRGGWTCVINRHYMSRDHGKNKAKLNFEAQSLHQFAPDCTIQFWENIWTKEAFEGSPALLTTT